MEELRKKYRMKPKAGAHYVGGERYVAEDIIELFDWEAEKIADKLIPLFKPPEKLPDPEPEVPLVVVETKDGWYVENQITGDRINDSPLTKKQAMVLGGTSATVLEMLEVDPEPITAVHKGGGRYAIVWEETGNKVVDKLYTRIEAQRLLQKIENGELTASSLVEK
jgi:hypothetical protein